MIRDNHQRVFGVENPGGFHERIDHEACRREQRTDQVLKDVLDDSILELVP